MNYFRQDSIISTNVNYSYNVFIKDLHKLTSLYPFISVGSIGKSIMGKDIPFIKIGNGSNEVFYSASYHANEWITSIVLMKFLADYCYCYSNNLTIFGYPASWLFNVSTIYLVPMVNPDGVDLVTGVFLQVLHHILKLQKLLMALLLFLFQMAGKQTLEVWI